MIKILLKNFSSISTITKTEFEKHTRIIWSNKIRFKYARFYNKALKKTQKALQNDLTTRQKWLSIHLQTKIAKDDLPDVSIRWINDAIGYGVFAETNFNQGEYLGEYTGVIRKRRIWKDRKNDYCFEYSLGDWTRNPFVIDAQKEGNFTRYINHSESPNLESVALVKNGIMHIVFISLKEIKKGEQLAYHYGDTFWKKRRHFSF